MKMAAMFPTFDPEDVGFMYFQRMMSGKGEPSFLGVYDSSHLFPQRFTLNPCGLGLASAASVRSFHVYWLESNLDFGLFQVPQAFHGMRETALQGSSPFGPKFFPDQVLGMERHLYSGQHAPAPGYGMLVPFLQSLGFAASPFDRYLFKRTCDKTQRSQKGGQHSIPRRRSMLTTVEVTLHAQHLVREKLWTKGR